MLPLNSKKQSMQGIVTYTKKVAMHLMTSTSIGADNAFLNIPGNAAGEVTWLKVKIASVEG